MDEQIDSRERPLVAAVLAELKVAASLLMPKLKKRYEHRTPNKVISEVGFQQDLKQKALLGAPYTHVPECFPTSSLVALLISLLSLYWSCFQQFVIMLRSPCNGAFFPSCHRSLTSEIALCLFRETRHLSFGP